VYSNTKPTAGFCTMQITELNQPCENELKKLNMFLSVKFVSFLDPRLEYKEKMRESVKDDSKMPKHMV